MARMPCRVTACRLRPAFAVVGRPARFRPGRRPFVAPVAWTTAGGDPGLRGPRTLNDHGPGVDSWDEKPHPRDREVPEKYQGSTGKRGVTTMSMTTKTPPAPTTDTGDSTLRTACMQRRIGALATAVVLLLERPVTAAQRRAGDPAREALRRPGCRRARLLVGLVIAEDVLRRPRQADCCSRFGSATTQSDVAIAGLRGPCRTTVPVRTTVDPPLTSAQRSETRVFARPVPAGRGGPSVLGIPVRAAGVGSADGSRAVDAPSLHPTPHRP